MVCPMRVSMHDSSTYDSFPVPAALPPSSPLSFHPPSSLPPLFPFISSSPLSFHPPSSLPPLFPSLFVPSPLSFPSPYVLPRRSVRIIGSLSSARRSTSSRTPWGCPSTPTPTPAMVRQLRHHFDSSLWSKLRWCGGRWRGWCSFCSFFFGGGGDRKEVGVGGWLEVVYGNFDII